MCHTMKMKLNETKAPKKTPKNSQSELNDIAERLKAGASYEDLLDELDATLGLEKDQPQNVALDQDWEDIYRSSK
jgi:hypothetical protein